MKVFTHYTKLGSTSDGIRWRTILKFGNSWEVKGSVVMKNPGAANFQRPDHAAINSPEELKQLSVFDDGELRADNRIWRSKSARIQHSGSFRRTT